MDIDTPEAAETLLSSVAIGLSYERQAPMDNARTEHEICKFGRYLQTSGDKWVTWCLPNQLLYDAYDNDLMNNPLPKNNIVVVHSNEEETPLFCPLIFGSWHDDDDDDDDDYNCITLNNIAYTALLLKYIPTSTATFEFVLVVK